MRVVAVTGVSRGLGAALLDQLLDRGDTVLAIGRRFTDRQRALAGPRLTLLTADLADPGALPGPAALAAALTRDGTAEVTDAALVHNAAVVGPIGPVGGLPGPELAAAVTVNLTAPALLTNAFLAAVPATARRVRLVFVSSGAADRPIEGWSAYCATKAGGAAFFAVVAAEAARRDPRVRVASVNPGVLDTGMQVALRAADFPDRERYVELHRSGRLPDPAGAARRIVDEHLTDG